MISKPLTPAQIRALTYMATGDRVLHRRYSGNNYVSQRVGNRTVYVATRRTVEILVERGLAEWMPDYPTDLRVMITDAGRRAVTHSDIERVVERIEEGGTYGVE